MSSATATATAGSSLFEAAKSFVGFAVSTVADALYASDMHLQTKFTPARAREELQKAFDSLTSEQKNQLYGKVWELGKMEDPRIHGLTWGQDHAFDNLERLEKALCRLGFFGKTKVHTLKCLSHGFGEGGLGSQYFSLGEKLGRDPLPGHVGYVNGMGVPTLEYAGWHAVQLSNLFVDGNNIHCVYHATHQAVPMGDAKGFALDALRMKAVDGGSYTKTAYLVTQQWIDFLTSNPHSNFLQVALSEGAAHVNAALRLLQEARPDLLGRVRVINFCPAYFIVPEDFSVTGSGLPPLQVVNLVKKEDGVINPWAVNIHKMGTSKHVKIVPHTGGGDPHNPFCQDFVKAAKVYFDQFMKDGKLY